MQVDSDSDSDCSQEFRRIYQKKLLEKTRKPRPASRSRSRDKPKERPPVQAIPQPVEITWHIYPRGEPIQLEGRVERVILELPIYRKQEEILSAVFRSQFVLVTGETGCGKSTQVPRLLYEYLRSVGDNKSRIMCVQPRRLAVLNLQSLL
jgi:ABC-type glutathione transport system ATPase component